jgi:hypothetical protein
MLTVAVLNRKGRGSSARDPQNISEPYRSGYERSTRLENRGPSKVPYARLILCDKLNLARNWRVPELCRKYLHTALQVFVAMSANCDQLRKQNHSALRAYLRKVTRIGPDFFVCNRFRTPSIARLARNYVVERGRRFDNLGFAATGCSVCDLTIVPCTSHAIRQPTTQRQR